MEFAIIGAAIRLPDVNDIDEFHTSLLAGRSGLRAVSPEDSLRNGVTEAEMANPRYVPVASPVERAELFDRKFFGMTAGEAASIDPQHRLLLTLAHEALESSGLDRGAHRIGIYTSTTLSARFLQRSETDGSLAISYKPMLGDDKDFCSARIAYKLGLTGPAIAVQSACSSSLVAVHQACGALAFGDADAAIVGGVSVSIPQMRGYLYQEGGVLSPTGQCRPFDAASNGTLKGNGGGVVVLRRLDDASADGDPILGVISGSAVNNDGRDRMGFTAPSAQGQQQVIRAALERAGFDAADVRYIETHGTGTQLGDPIEFRALAGVYDPGPGRHPPCHLGSLKSSYGHLDAAAGIVGLIKAMLVVRGRQIYPQANFTAPNPLVDLAATRFEISSESQEFPSGACAAVSAFGMGGTNCHVILRSVLPAKQTHSPSGYQPGAPVDVEVGARTAVSAARFGARLARYLRRNPGSRPVDVAATLARRAPCDVTYRLRVRGHDELVSALDSLGDAAPAAPSPTGIWPAGERIWLPPTPLDEVDAPVEQSAPHARATSPPATTAGSASFSVREQCLLYMAEELGIPVNEDADFFGAGGESVGLVEIVGRLTAEHNFVADFERLDGISIAGAIATEMQRQAADEPPGRRGSDATVVAAIDPVIEFGPPSQVYWHPPVGGSNFCYSALNRLCPTVGFHTFRAVLQDGAPTIEDIAARNIRTLRDRQALSDRLILGGYSFGGNVGLEMAFQLERSGIRPQLLVLFDSRLPTAYLGTDKTDADYDEGIQMTVRQGVRGAHQSGAGDPLAVFSRLIEDGGSAAGVLFRDFAQLWRNNQRALAAYKPTGVLSCPIVIFSTAQPLLPEEHHWLGIEDLPATEWQRYSSLPVEVITVPGDHYSLFLDTDCLRIVAERLPAVLARGR
jgi:phthiocerol/phenolphthiocerol synthesis type-I polyketide synthase E